MLKHIEQMDLEYKQKLEEKEVLRKLMEKQMVQELQDQIVNFNFFFIQIESFSVGKFSRQPLKFKQKTKFLRRCFAFQYLKIPIFRKIGYYSTLWPFLPIQNVFPCILRQYFDH